MSMFDIGLSGLRYNSIGMTVSAQNTANVNNPSYSRQRVDSSALIFGGTGGHVIGSGVQVDSIRRVADNATIESLRMSHESHGYASAYSYGMDSIESVLTTDGLSITSGLNGFFAAIDETSLTPESLVLRQQVIESADGLASQFRSIVNQLEKSQSELSQQFSSMTESVNASLQSIAELNHAINKAGIQGQNTSGLQDSLDAQLQTLSGMIGVDIVRQSNGTVDVSLSNGQPLVVGETAGQLSLVPGSGVHSTALNLDFAGQTSPVHADLGGRMGAIEDIQRNEFAPLRQTLDDMVVAFADEVNGVLSEGYDLSGNPSEKPLFTYNPDNPAASFSITDIEPEELAFSGDGAVGDASILTELSSLANKPLSYGSVEGVSIYDAYSQIIGGVGVATMKATTSADTTLTAMTEAQMARDNISAVSGDEEAANLMMYMNAYEANMKVITTANQMFQTVLSAF